MPDNKQPLTSAEIANLWNLYMQDTMIVCFKKYLVAKAEDKQIRTIQEEALNISERRSKNIASIFSSDNLPVPVGFSDKDVNIDAPRLFSDTFALYHVLSRTRWALLMISTALFLATRPDVRKLFLDANASSAKLNENATQVALSKGLLIRSPIINISQTPHFVEKPSYIGHIIGKHRPLHVISLTHLFLSIHENYLGRALITGFSQVAHNPEVREYFIRGAEIGTKHIKILSSFLSDEDIPIPQSNDSMVTNSTIPPFSDKFMMNHITTANTLSIADMGIAIGQSNRADIAADYTRLAAEIIQYGEDGVNISIKNGWLEAAPQVVSHKELAASGKIN
jgi:hypothetical protein